jgi:3-oxoacyl-[acyl-carrier protein] reductase
VLRVFLAQGQGGSIVSLGAIGGVISSPNATAYGVAKSGLINLARSVAAEYGRFNIRMNVVTCGPIVTPAHRSNHPASMVAPVPMGRAGDPSEIADAVVFFASSFSSYVNGQSLVIDGGATVHFPLPTPNTDPSTAG